MPTSMVETVEGGTQTILVGPVASLVSIMQLGTNGGGYFGANDAHPFMNPNPASNFFEMFLMMLIPTALIFVFGNLIGKKKEAKPILIGAYGLFAIKPCHRSPTLYPSCSPRIETRIGGFISVLWTTVTTATGTGSVNTVLSAMPPAYRPFRFYGHVYPGHTGRHRYRLDVHDNVHNHNGVSRWINVWQDTRIFRDKNYGARRQTCYDCVPDSPPHNSYTHHSSIRKWCSKRRWIKRQLHWVHTNTLGIHHQCRQQRLRLFRRFRKHSILQHLNCGCNIPRPLCSPYWYCLRLGVR